MMCIPDAGYLPGNTDGEYTVPHLDAKDSYYGKRPFYSIVENDPAQ
jgi:hypothetical protein